MKALSLQLTAAAAVLVMVFAPSASARSKAHVKLSVLPLPASSIGSAATSLPLQRAGSGVLGDGSGDATTPNGAFGFFGPVFGKVGWIGGYALDYGLGASGGTGVTEVRTSVDQFRTNNGAKKGLVFRKLNDSLATRWAGGGLAITDTAVTVPRVGSRRFAFLVGYSDSNITPLFGVDEEFTEGRYEADVTVWAGSAAAAKQLAPRLAKKLDGRIKRGVAGKLHAKPVKLPPKQKAGPPPGGPDLSRLALQTTDISGTSTAFVHNYWVGGPLPPFTVSEYRALFMPAGKFNFLEQQIQWYATANQASFEADFEAALFGKYAIDLSSLGDGARGAVANGGSGDSTGYAELVFSSGPLEELVVFSSDNPIQTADAQSIAQKVASYIDAAGLGS